jgi:hypothetical protein
VSGRAGIRGGLLALLASLIALGLPAAARADSVTLGSAAISADPGVIGWTTASVAVSGNGAHASVALAATAVTPNRAGALGWMSFAGALPDVEAPHTVPFAVRVKPPLDAVGGTYTFTISAVVGGARTASATLKVTVPGPPPITYTARIDASTLHVDGQAAIPATLALTVSRGSKVVLHRTVHVKGAIALRLPLPRGLKSGAYTLLVHATDASAGIPDSRTRLELAPTALVSRAWLSVVPRGNVPIHPHALLRIYSNFSFSAPPKSKVLTVLWYRDGILQRHGQLRYQNPTSDSVTDGGQLLVPGLYWCVLRVDGKSYSTPKLHIG